MAVTQSPPEYHHETIIQPSQGWMNLRWREVWDYRDLLFMLVQRDFTSRYKQTVLGPAWYLLQPILTTLVFVIVFRRVANISTDDIPGPLFYLAGLVGWNFFAQNVVAGGATFLNNTHLFTKVWFPRVIMPVATVLSNLITAGLQLLPVLIFYIYYKYVQHLPSLDHPDLSIVLTVLPVAQIGLLSLGISLWIAGSTVRFRDLVHLVTFLIQLWMFATPVIYPLSMLREKWPALIYLNPVAVPVEATRYLLLGKGSLQTGEVVFSVLLTLIIFITGLALFQKSERNVVDNV